MKVIMTRDGNYIVDGRMYEYNDRRGLYELSPLSMDEARLNFPNIPLSYTETELETLRKEATQKDADRIDTQLFQRTEHELDGINR